MFWSGLVVKMLQFGVSGLVQLLLFFQFACKFCPSVMHKCYELVMLHLFVIKRRLQSAHIILHLLLTEAHHEQ